MKKRLLIGLLTLLMSVGVLFGLAACQQKVEQISIDRDDQPQSTYVLGTQLNLNKGAIDADGTKIPLNADGVSVTGFDGSVLGQQTLTITYGGKTTEFTVTVVPRFRTMEDYVYFVGESLSDADIRLTITRDDGSTIAATADTAELTITGFDSSAPAEKLTLNAVYEKDSDRFEGTFDVAVVQPEISFKAPTSGTEYGSHEEELNLAGMSVRLSDAGGDTVRNVPLSSLRAEGFDPSVVTKDNPASEQEIKIFYHDLLVGSFKVKITYSSVSAFKDAAEDLSDLDWNCYRQPTADDRGMAYPKNITDDAQKTLATEQLIAYLGMRSSSTAFITQEELEAVARLAVVHGYNRWNALMNEKFSSVFTVDELANITYICDTQAKAQAGIAALEDENDMSELRKFADMLSDPALPLLLADSLLYTGYENGDAMDAGGLKIPDLASVIPDATYFTDVREVLEWAIDAFGKATTATPEDVYNRIIEISNRTYKKELDGETMEILIGNTSIFSMMNSWTEDGDFFYPLYKHYYSILQADGSTESDKNSATTHIDNLSALMFPKALEGMRMYFLNGQDMQELMKSYAENYMSVPVSDLLVESTLFMYLYNEALAASRQFLESNTDPMLMDLYTTYYSGVIANMLGGEFGYLQLRDASVYEKGVNELWDAYLEIYLAVDDDASYMDSDAFAANAEAMMQKFFGLAPAQQYYFILSMNYLYPYLPAAALYPDEDGSLYSDFARFIYRYISDEIAKQVGDDTDAGNAVYTLFADFMLAAEYYANGATDAFCNTMKALKATYDGWAADSTERKAFDAVCGEFSKPYFDRYALFEETDEKDDEGNPVWQYKPELAVLGEAAADFNAIKDTIEAVFIAQTHIDGLNAQLGMQFPLYLPFLASYEKLAAQDQAFREKYGDNATIMNIYENMPCIEDEYGVMKPISYYLYVAGGKEGGGKYELYLAGLGIDKAEFEQSGLPAFLKTYEQYFWTAANLLTQGVIPDPYREDPDQPASFTAELVSGLLDSFRSLTAQERYFLLTLDSGINLLHEGLAVYAEQTLFPDSETATLVDNLLNVQISYIGYEIASDADKTEMKKDLLEKWGQTETLYALIVRDKPDELNTFKDYFGSMYDAYKTICKEVDSGSAAE